VDPTHEYEKRLSPAVSERARQLLASIQVNDAERQSIEAYNAAVYSEQNKAAQRFVEIWDP
jgi:hypothetical protein